MRIDDEGTYSICLEYEDICFSKADHEDAVTIFLKWVEYLNSFTEHTHVVITNAGTPVDTTLFKEDFVYTVREGMSETQKVMAEEFNTLIANSIGSKKDTLMTKRYLTISQKASSFEEAEKLFFNMYLKTEEKFHELKSSVRIVPMNERLTLIHDFWNMHTAYDRGIEDFEEYAKENDMTIFDVIAPKEKISFREADYIEVLADEENSKFIRVLYMDSKLPKSMTPKFYNMLTTLEDIHLITTLNIQPTNSAKSIDVVAKKLSGLETERFDKIKKLAKQQINYAYVKDKRIENGIENLTRLQEDMTKNDQKVFNTNLIVCIVANSFSELEEHTLRVKDKAGEMLIKFNALKWEQLEGVQHSLPLGHNMIQFQRTLTSEATAVNVPFNSKDFMHKHSLYYGINEVSKNAIMLDRKKLLNGNGCVLATSGAGKSFAIKLMAEQIFLRYPNDDIIFLDYQKEYADITQHLNGQTVSFSNSANTHINPMDLDKNYDLSEDGNSTPIKSKIEYMQGWVESIIDEGRLTAIQKTIVDRCTKLVYNEYEKSGFKDKTLLPKLSDFYNCLKEQSEQQAQNLATALERFVSGSQDIFSHSTNVDIHNRVVNYDISELSSSIQTAGYLVILDHVWNRVASNREQGKYTWLFIDEFHLLLANPSAGAFVAKFYKTGRKFNLMNTIITQNLVDVLKNEFGVKILLNSEFAMILKQKAGEREQICNLFDISTAESRYIANDAKAGQGVIVFGSDKIPFYNHVPKETLLYKTNNTDGLVQAR